VVVGGGVFCTTSPSSDSYWAKRTAERRDDEDVADRSLAVANPGRPVAGVGKADAIAPAGANRGSPPRASSIEFRCDAGISGADERDGIVWQEHNARQKSAVAALMDCVRIFAPLSILIVSSSARQSSRV
jgi:hypothetical protein